MLTCSHPIIHDFRYIELKIVYTLLFLTHASLSVNITQGCVEPKDHVFRIIKHRIRKISPTGWTLATVCPSSLYDVNFFYHNANYQVL